MTLSRLFPSKVPLRALWAAVPVGLFILIAILAPLLATHDPVEQNLMDAKEGISAAHLLGTDHLGRDTASRLIYGARTRCRRRYHRSWP